MASPPVLRALQGQRAAVLGSTSGIGRACALALADAGADVIVHGRASQRRGR
jgi:NAD(P)-dependent dehydrogenase (short-subunit alcohol dehydrogenase family)